MLSFYFLKRTSAQRYLAMDKLSYPYLKNSCRFLTLRMLKTQKLWFKWSEHDLKQWSHSPIIIQLCIHFPEEASVGGKLLRGIKDFQRKKPHTIAETPVKPCAMEMAELKRGEVAKLKTAPIPLRNDKMYDRIWTHPQASGGANRQKSSKNLFAVRWINWYLQLS